MFVLFFTIVFIAELIVVAKVISVLQKCDSQVQEFNNQIIQINPEFKKGVEGAQKAVTSLTGGVGLFNKFIDKKKYELIRLAAKAALAVLFVIVIKKIPNKKLLTVIDMVFMFEKFLQT